MFDIKDIIEVVLILYYKVQRPDDLRDSLEPIHNHHQYTFFLLLRGKFINVKCILRHQKFIEMFILFFSFNFFRSILIDKLQNTYIIIYKFQVDLRQFVYVFIATDGEGVTMKSAKIYALKITIFCCFLY